MNVSLDQVVQAIGEILRSAFEVNEKGDYAFEFGDIQLAPVSRDKLASVAEVINSLEQIDDNAVMTKTSFEVLVQSSSTRAMRFLSEVFSLTMCTRGFPTDSAEPAMPIRFIYGLD